MRAPSRNGLCLRATLVVLWGTLLVSVASSQSRGTLPTPDFSSFFSPDTIGPGSNSTLRFTIVNSQSTPLTDLDFTDVLPAGMVISSPSSALTDCADAILSAPDGGTTISFSDGRLGAGNSCTVTVNVEASSTGTSMTGDLTSSAGNSGSTSATLTVDTALSGFSKEFSPSSIPEGGRSTLTFTIDNSQNAADLANLSFSDPLPIGIVVASPANASTDCPAGLGDVLTAAPGSSQISYSVQGFLPSFPTLGAGSTCTVTVDVTTVSAGAFTNNTGSLQVDFSSAGFATAALESSISFLSKSFLDDPVAPGGDVTLQFTLENPSRSDAATNITFSDDLTFLAGLSATGLPLVGACESEGSGPGTGTLSGTTTLTFTGGSLPPEGSCSFTVTLAVPPGAIPGTYFNTTSAVSATIGGGSYVGNVASDALFVSLAPTLTKEFLTNPVGAGASTTLRFVISNNSTTSSLTDIGFEDTFSDVLRTASVVPSDPVCNTGTASFTPFVYAGPESSNIPARFAVSGASLGPSEQCTIELTLDVLDNATEGTYPNTTSPISALEGGSNEVEGAPASDALVVVGSPSLSKEFIDDPVASGGTVRLDFTLSHSVDASATATGISFSDDLSFLTGLAAADLPLLQACDPDGPGGAVGSGTLTGDTTLSFSGGSLAPGETCVVSVALDVPGSATPGSYTNTTSNVMATVLGVAVVGNFAVDDLQVAGLKLTKEFLDDPVIPGATVTLEYRLENVSQTETAGSIQIQDNFGSLLPGVPDITGDGVGRTDVCGPGNGVLSWSSGNTFVTLSGATLAPSETCSASLTLNVPAGAASGTYTSTTSSFSALMPGFVAFEPVSDELIINGDLLFLTKEFIDDPVLPGGTVTLRFTLSNLDPAQTASNISFSDDLDAVMAGLVASALPASGQACGGTIAGTGLLVLSGGSLAAGATCTFDVVLDVPAGAANGTTATNVTSTVTGQIGGLAIVGDPATDQLSIDSIRFSKVFDGPTVPGGSPRLTFTIENLSPLDSAPDLAFTDNLESVVPALVAIALPSNPCGAGSALLGSSLLVLSGGALAPGATCSFDVDLFVPFSTEPGSYRNTTSKLRSAGIPIAGEATADLSVIDIEGPLVTEVSTEAGPLPACGAVRLPIFQIRATVEDLSSDIVGAGDEANYELLASGPDGDFSTSTCGLLAGDDVSVPILGLSFDAIDPRAVQVDLTVSGLPGLTPGLYRLLICDSIVDSAGNALDGDADMTPGGDFLVPLFRADPYNLFDNGHFDDCPADLTPWTVTVTSPNVLTPGELGIDDVDGAALSASAEIVNTSQEPSFLSQCVAVEAGTVYQLEAWLRFDPLTALGANVAERCVFFDAPSCVGSSLGESSTAVLIEDEGGDWIVLERPVSTPALAVSAQCDFGVEAVGGALDFSLYLDALFLGLKPVLFIDGFESGSTAAWSAEIP